MQEELADIYPIIKSLPWNHFGRKNIGYLYAIHHQAKLVYDFDDDNIIINKHYFHQFHSVYPAASSNHPPFDTNAKHEYLCQVPINCTDMIINPYPLLGAKIHPIWPRGYPLEYIRSTYYQPILVGRHNNNNLISPGKAVMHLKATNISVHDIGIIQLLANHDPDVDAIYRMTLPLPYNFPLDGNLPLLIPKSAFTNTVMTTAAVQSTSTATKIYQPVYTPYNAQATIHFYSALWSLYLPISVHGRVSDIWRSYFTQRLLQDFPSIQLLFSSPNVIQERNVHRYLADFNSEIPLYQQSTRLVEQLQSLRLCCCTLPGRMEELYIFLFEHGYIQKDDVVMIQQWIQSLLNLKYSFPTLPKKSSATCYDDDQSMPQR
jgi:hypothetical protein